MISQRTSNNYKTLKNILSKIRQLDFTSETSYLIIYAFVYKYCSDMLKDHFMNLIQDKEITLDEAYNDPKYQELFRDDAFKMFGYYIPDSDLFLDELINNKYSDGFFIHEFINAFSKNVEFGENRGHEKYFNFIFNSIRDEINLNKFEFEGENHLIVKDLVYTISKLSIFENEFPFERVFDRVCDSRLIRVDRDPEYITDLLSAIIITKKNNLNDVYNPFLNDASSLISLSNRYNNGIGNLYGKGSDRITYCAGIAKFLFEYFDLERVFLEFGFPFESVDMEGEFDAIISRIPLMTPKRIKRWNSVQSKEITKRNTKKQLVNSLSKQLNLPLESFENDMELKNTVEGLVNKMDDKPNMPSYFEGEYEVLKNSEYLFLIDLLDSLRDNGIMAVSLPQSFLFKNTLETLRKYLTVGKNYIDCIIALPDELSRRRSSDVIVVFRKDKPTDDVVFIDLSKEYSTKMGGYPVSGLFKRNLVLSEKTTYKVVEAYDRRQTIDRFSNVVRIDDIARNEFNLSVSRYVDTFEGEFIRLEDLKDQKEEITSNIKKLNEKIDRMMDELNIRL